MFTDTFGLTHLHDATTDPARARSYYSTSWSNGTERTIVSKGTSVRNSDPYDPWFDFHCKAEDKGVKNVCVIDGKGNAQLSGRAMRIYINDPARLLTWLNVELTWSVKAESQVSGGGAFVITRGAGRSNHQNEYNCSVSGNGYYG